MVDDEGPATSSARTFSASTGYSARRCRACGGPRNDALDPQFYDDALGGHLLDAGQERFGHLRRPASLRTQLRRNAAPRPRSPVISAWAMISWTPRSFSLRTPPASTDGGDPAAFRGAGSRPSATWRTPRSTSARRRGMRVTYMAITGGGRSVAAYGRDGRSSAAPVETPSTLGLRVIRI